MTKYCGLCATYFKTFTVEKRLHLICLILFVTEFFFDNIFFFAALSRSLGQSAKLPFNLKRVVRNMAVKTGVRQRIVFRLNSPATVLTKVTVATLFTAYN